jgi:4-hydroxy-4-methyl-2-oxoglutarate aldolase
MAWCSTGSKAAKGATKIVAIAIHAMPETLPADLRAALGEVSFPTIGHFLEEGFVDPAIRAMVTPVKIVSRAVTVRITAPDSVLVHKATELLEPGDALVIDIGGDTRHAPVGEMVALAAQERGGVAIVLDGVCTDIVEIRALGMPVFARGTSVLTTKLHGLSSGAINAPVACGGVVVRPGDVVLGDDNGVLVLPVAVAQAVVGRARQSDDREPATREYLRGGGSLPELTGANQTVARLLANAEPTGC